MIDTILDAIIKDSLSGIDDNEVFFGIAETVIRQSGNIQERMPGIVNYNGEIKYAGIDDVNSLMVYFKNASATIANTRNGFGDRLGDFRNVFSVGMYVYWDTKRIKLSVDEMLMMMQSRLPNAIIGIENAKTVLLIPITANTNTFQIYLQEYGSGEGIRPLPESKRIMQFNFNIEITFNPECFRKCPECTEK